MMKKISVVIITLNEEKNISRCIESVTEVADEIIVIDSHSTDNTRDLSSGLGARVVETDWKGYADTKNYGNNLARYDYILSLDADEALSDELKQSIKSNKEKGLEKDAYSMNRLTNFCGRWIRHGGWYPDLKTRLWKKGRARWSGTIHEKLILTDNKKAEMLHGELLHFAFSDIGQHISQINRFSSLAAERAYKKNKKTGIVGIIGRSYWKFLRDFVVRAGFLDGYYGYVIARNSAHATFLKYAKLRELNKTNERGG